jgi:Cu/Zn superoxide dismutase
LTFRLAPEPGVTATGTISLVAAQKTTSIELKITGLQANSSHVSHIHLGSCQSRGGIAFALNQVVADGQGAADVRSRLDLTYPPNGTTWYVVVHAGPDMVSSNASYLLCGNLFS